MNSTCNCSESMDNLTENTSSSNMNKKQETGDVLFVLLILFVFLTTVAIWLIYMILAKLRSFIAWPITPTPTIPKWLGPSGSESKRCPQLLNCGVKIQTRRVQVDFSQGALNWIQEILRDRFGVDHIPRDTCLVSVPMENFKCGQEPTDFEPVSGKAPGSHCTYQMFGDNRIQITRYVEGGVVYVAGYCVYISDPDARRVNYNARHIRMCYTGPKYKLPDRTNWSFVEIERVSMDALSRSSSVPSLGFPDSEDLEGGAPETVQLTTESLKSHYCTSALEPVLLGWESGVLKHFRWSRDTKTFKTSECSSCEAIGDRPPAYQWLDV